MQNNGLVELKLGSVLNRLLKEKRTSLRQLSRESGVPYSTLAEWTSNRPPKNPVQVQKVAAHFNVSMHYLYFGVEDQSEPLTKLLKEDLFSGTFEISIKRVRIE